MKCNDCGRNYYPDDIESHEHGVHIDAFIPDDGQCHDCGSSNIQEGSDPLRFESELEVYKATKDELLSFYDHYVRINNVIIKYEYRVS